MSYTASVTKELPIGVRFEPEEIAALKTWAKEDQRPVSALIRKIVTDAMRSSGRMTKGDSKKGSEG